MKPHRPAIASVLGLLALSACATPPDPTSIEWRPVVTGVDASLRGLSVSDIDTVWASGSGALVLRTSNGGRSWNSGTLEQLVGENEIRDVHAFDDATAIAMAIQPAALLRTTDGGKSWDVAFRPDAAQAELFLDGLAVEGDRGLAFGDPLGGRLSLLSTDDAGKSWSWLQHAPVALPDEAGFAASGTSMVLRGQGIWIGTGGSEARVHRSTDGGTSWTVARAPLAGGEPSKGVFSVAFVDDLHGVMVGGDYRQEDVAAGSAAWTTDGGATWHATSCTGFRSGVACVPGTDGQVWFAVGPSGTDRSLDGGRSWQNISDVGYHAIAFAPDERVGWAVGSGGRAAVWDGR